MASRHVIVDGSNLATEGRTTPSLAQLEEVLADLRREMPDAQVTAVVDASFPHRIDPSERERYEELSRAGELVSPPAGAVGRGDAFLLRIAERVDGIVLSNDSFQEFHAEHPWLFDRGRLIGASRVPGIGWIFVLRSPVRAPREKKPQTQSKRAQKEVQRAIASATREAVSSNGREKSKSNGKDAQPLAPPRAVNDPATFIAFVAEHRPGDDVDAVVESFASHGAVVRSGDVLAYVPLAGLGDPAPRSARAALKRGETRRFVVTALDPYRRGVEVALPGVGTVSGRPSDETVAAVVKLSHTRKAKAPAKKAAKRVEAQKKRPTTAARPKARKEPQRPASQPAAGPRRSPRAEKALKVVRTETGKSRRTQNPRKTRSGAETPKKQGRRTKG